MTRKTKISCDVTREADNMLKAYCLKHERSKGYLIEKMIRRFCNETIEATAASLAVAKVEKPKVKRFVPPTFNEVDVYMISLGVNDNGEANNFINFYESNGWKVGRNKMKSWQASIRNWLKNNHNKKQRVTGKTSGNFSACEDFING